MVVFHGGYVALLPVQARRAVVDTWPPPRSLASRCRPRRLISRMASRPTAHRAWRALRAGVRAVRCARRRSAACGSSAESSESSAAVLRHHHAVHVDLSTTERGESVSCSSYGFDLGWRRLFRRVDIDCELHDRSCLVVDPRLELPHHVSGSSAHRRSLSVGVVAASRLFQHLASSDLSVGVVQPSTLVQHLDALIADCSACGDVPRRPFRRSGTAHPARSSAPRSWCLSRRSAR